MKGKEMQPIPRESLGFKLDRNLKVEAIAWLLPVKQKW